MSEEMLADDKTAEEMVWRLIEAVECRADANSHQYKSARLNVDKAREALVSEIERLRGENFALAANQCKAGYSGEHGDHMCRLLDALRKARAFIVYDGKEFMFSPLVEIDAAIKQAGG